MQGFSFLLDHPLQGLLFLVFAIVFLIVGIGLSRLGKAVKICLDIVTFRKTLHETRKLQDEERTRKSPIQPSTLEDVRRYDPRIRAVDRTVEAEDQAKKERLKRWYDGLQGIAALLAALREMLDSIRNARRRGAPPDDDRT